MTDIGRFRTVDVADLERFVYRDNESSAQRDIQSLRQQGLIEEKTIFEAHRPARKVLTLTPRGHSLLQKTGSLPNGQRIYHGFVKPRESSHDADLYKVYQQAVREISESGGKPLRVRLDFELKEVVNRAKESARTLSHEERAALLRGVAERNGLQVRAGRINLPDVQVEYETRDGELRRENLELVSRNYREDGIRGKASAGFRLYARAGEAARIRRALNDTGILRQVFSV